MIPPPCINDDDEDEEEEEEDLINQCSMKIEEIYAYYPEIHFFFWLIR